MLQSGLFEEIREVANFLNGVGIVYQQEVWGILSSSNQQLYIHHTVYMEVLESRLVSSIEELYGICMAMNT